MYGEAVGALKGFIPDVGGNGQEIDDEKRERSEDDQLYETARGNALGEVAKFGGDAPAKNEKKDEQSVKGVYEKVRVVLVRVGFGAGELGRRRGVFEDGGLSGVGRDGAGCGGGGYRWCGRGGRRRGGGRIGLGPGGCDCEEAEEEDGDQTLHRDCSRRIIAEFSDFGAGLLGAGAERSCSTLESWLRYGPETVENSLLGHS